MLDEGACPVVEAANLDAVPFFARPFVRNAFEDAAPVVLDWHGEIGERLGFEPDSVNLYLVDSDGALVAHFRGEAGPRSTTRLKARMEEHCREGD